MTKVFISYSRKDKFFAEKLHSALSSIELESWIDWIDIPPVADWKEQVYQGIEAADGFLFLLSPDSVKSVICGEEIDHAVKNGKRLIPLVVRDINANDVHPALTKLNWIFFRERDDFALSLKNLEAGIKTDLVWVEAHRRLQVRAVEWEKRKDRSLLLRGKDLREAEEQLATSGQKDPQPTDLQRQYVLEGRRGESRNRNFVLVISTVVMVALALLSIFAENQRNIANDNAATAIANENARATAQTNAQKQEAVAISERDRAQIALSRLLAKRSIDQLNVGNLEQSLLLSLEAYQTMPTFEARNSLLAGMEYSPHLSTFLRTNRQLGDQVGKNILFNPDGTLWVTYLAGSVHVFSWDVDTREGGLVHRALYPAGRDAVFSPDGHLLAISNTGAPNNIIFFNMSNGEKVGDWIALPGELGHNGILAFTPSGEMIAVNIFDNTLLLWDVTTRELKLRIDGISNFAYLPIAFSTDGNMMAVQGNNGDNSVLTIRDTLTGNIVGEPIPLVEKIGLIRALAFSQDNSLLAIGGSTIVLWDISNHKIVDELPIETTGINLKSLAFSPDGRQLAISILEKGVWLWDIVKRELIELIANETLVTGGPIAFNPDGRMLAAMSSTGDVMLFDSYPIHAIHRPLLNSDVEVNNLIFSSDSSILLTRKSDEKTILAWEISTGQSVAPTSDRIIEPTGETVSLSWTCLKQTRAGCEDHQIFLEDVLIGAGHGDVSVLALSPDEKVVAVGIVYDTNDPGRIILLNVADGQQKDLPGFGDNKSISSLSFSSDGKSLAASSADGLIALYNLTTSTGTYNDPLIGDQNQTASELAFSLDGSLLASASSDKIMLWDVAAMQALVESPGGFSNTRSGFAIDSWNTTSNLAFSPDNKWLAIHRDSEISIWNIDFEAWRLKACQLVNRNFSRDFFNDEWEQFFGNELYRKTCSMLPD